jgi:RNA polymerase sigma-70 factor (ECF subfamily)
LSSQDAKGAARDAQLFRALGAGDEQAMAQIYDCYSSLVYSIALRVLGDAGAAEDVLQNVFMQLWRDPGVFDARRGSLPAWLAVITRHRAIDWLRKRRPESDIVEITVAARSDLASETERSSTLEKVRETLAGMPETQRSLLELAFFEGLTHSEIAAKTGEPLGTIKTRIRNGLLFLREALSP